MYYRFFVYQEFLGLIFSLHNCNVSRQITYLEPLLPKVFRIPTGKINLEEENLTEEVLLNIFIDATEQQIRRPEKQQKKYYSGKKEKHTIKNQKVVTGKGKILSARR